MSKDCPTCLGTNWVCESHPDKPMGHDECTDPGMPCETCGGDFPKLPPDFIPERGKYIGQPVGGPVSEHDHFIRCAVCGGLVDMRDLANVFSHEGPLPHPAIDQKQ